MFAVIEIPDFPLAAVLWRKGGRGDKPCALASSVGRKSVLECVNASASANGVRAGMSTARGLARCPKLELIEKDPAAGAAMMDWLIALGSGISPGLEITSQGRITVDLRGAGEVSAVASRMVAVADESKVSICVGISDTPERAGWASLRGEEMNISLTGEELFEGLSIGTGRVREEVRTTLIDWGFSEWLSFVRLEKEDVGRRLGPEGVFLWEEMKGRRCRLLRTLQKPPRFRSGMELESSIETLEQALFVIRRLLEEVCTSLFAAGKVARSLELAWRTEGRVEDGHFFTLPESTARVKPLFSMMESYLSGVRTETALCFIGLEAQPCDPLPEQRDFWEISAKSPFQFQETTGRLVGVLGEGRAGVPVRKASHHPDAWHVEAPPSRLRVEESPPVFGRTAGPALRRFRPPQKVEVWCRDGIPVRCAWRKRVRRVHSVRGPWRISGDWWDPHDRWSREEWDVEWGEGSFYRLVRYPEGQWEWDGVYD